MSEQPPTTPDREPPVPLHTPPTSPQRPKGILKNASQSNINGTKLTWDEENIAAAETERGTLMKIDEPKTPFVRYQPELENEDGDVPSFQLDDQAPSSPTGTSFRERTAENTLANAGRTQPFPSSPSGSPSVLRTPVRSSSSDRGSRRPSFSTTRSGSSSRSTSFSLTLEDLGRTEFREGGLGLVRDENDTAVEDEEALDAEALQKREEFRKARGRHYSNEAEAMKRAKELAAEEDEETDSGDANMHDGEGNVPTLPNGRPNS